MTTTPPVTPEDEFAAAFAELNSPSGSAPADPPADPPAEDPPADPPADPPVPTDPPADPPADPPVPADPPADPPAAVPPTAPAETEEQMRARIRAELEAEIAKPAPPAADPPADPPAPKKMYSAEEEARLAKYQEDWPDIAACEQLRRRAEYNDVINHVFNQLRPIIEEMQAKMSSYGKRTLYDDLTEMIPDYDEVRDKALAWIDTQPEYLKAAYRHVADNGTAEEVADLINRYKRETNYQAPTPAPATPAVAPAPATPAVAPAPATPAVAPAAAAAAAAMAPVNTGRTELPKPGPDMDDFDSAFAEFAKSKK